MPPGHEAVRGEGPQRRCYAPMFSSGANCAGPYARWDGDEVNGPGQGARPMLKADGQSQCAGDLTAAPVTSGPADLGKVRESALSSWGYRTYV